MAPSDDPRAGLEALSLAGEGALAAEALPLVEKQVHGMSKTLHTSIFRDISEGLLTPERAFSAWMELYAYHRLLKRFSSTIKVGQSAAERSPAALAQAGSLSHAS